MPFNDVRASRASPVARVVGRQSDFAGNFAAFGTGADNYLGQSNRKENAYFCGQLDEVRMRASESKGLLRGASWQVVGSKTQTIKQQS